MRSVPSATNFAVRRVTGCAGGKPVHRGQKVELGGTEYWIGGINTAKRGARPAGAEGTAIRGDGRSAETAVVVPAVVRAHPDVHRTGAQGQE